MVIIIHIQTQYRIRSDGKIYNNVSNQWKDLVTPFLVLGKYLDWKVGDGTLIRVKYDAIMGFPRGKVDGD